MQFVKTENLKKGMRIARPIYSKKGVLLFERNSCLTVPAIDSVRNFGLLGIYVLEPTEPLPPMSEEDLEFERFQVMSIFSIQEELEKILATGKQNRMPIIAGMIIKRFGHLEDKINFYHNLRSREDFIFRHSLNVAILCAMITHVMNVRLEEQQQTVFAAIVHDIGRMSLPAALVCGDDVTDSMLRQMYNEQAKTAELIEHAFVDGIAVRRICMQALRVQQEMLEGNRIGGLKLVTGAKILLVANRYDEITAMNGAGTAQSEVQAIKELQANPEIYDPEVVNALIKSINILFPGVSIELNTGEKALVLRENKKDVLRPVVLSFRDNSIIDMSLLYNQDIEVVDIMKTMDNRYIMDTETLRQVGYLS